MLSVATGLIFQLMIARTTTKQEYGIWFNIGDVVAYFTLLAVVFPFWTMRFVARDKEGAAKTGILTNLTLSAITTLIYLPLIPFITSLLDIPTEYTILYFLASLQIIELYSITALEACLQARIPHTLGLLFDSVFQMIYRAEPSVQ
jgi:O-antigen/teichoic acid export membrane protein